MLKFVKREQFFLMVTECLFEFLGLLEKYMRITDIKFYLDKNGSHGQNVDFLRLFLLKLNLCRPKEDLSNWELRLNSQLEMIEIYQYSKQMRVFIVDKRDMSNLQLIENQNNFIKNKIKDYQQNFISRERLMFVELTNDLESNDNADYILCENKNVVQFLKWSFKVEICDWMAKCAETLEDDNWFKTDINNYI